MSLLAVSGNELYLYQSTDYVASTHTGTWAKMALTIKKLSVKGRSKAEVDFSGMNDTDETMYAATKSKPGSMTIDCICDPAIITTIKGLCDAGTREWYMVSYGDAGSDGTGVVPVKINYGFVSEENPLSTADDGKAVEYSFTIAFSGKEYFKTGGQNS